MADEFFSIQTIRENIKKELREVYPDREIDAISDILFRTRLQLKKHELGLNRNKILARHDQDWFDKAIHKLKAGYPVQHITGQAEFYGMVLDVTPEVLIPRPETEELARWIIDEKTGSEPVILDIGTGSGCIALALKMHITGSSMMAMDINGSALVVASKNAAKLGFDIEFFLYDILEKNFPPGLPRIDIIVSNPPYIPLGEKENMDIHITDHEPHSALFVPDKKPLMFYEAISNFSSHFLKEGGLLFLEVHEDYGMKVFDLLDKKGFTEPEIRKDINGKDRMIKAIRQ